MNNLIISRICLLKTANIGLACVLQLHPTEVELSLYELEPEHVPEQALILGDGSLVEDQIQGETALEVQGYVVHVPCVLLHEGFFGKVERKYFGL